MYRVQGLLLSRSTRQPKLYICIQRICKLNGLVQGPCRQHVKRQSYLHGWVAQLNSDRVQLLTGLMLLLTGLPQLLTGLPQLLSGLFSCHWALFSCFPTLIIQSFCYTHNMLDSSAYRNYSIQKATSLTTLSHMRIPSSQWWVSGF